MHEAQVAVNDIPDADEVNHVGYIEPGLPVKRGTAMFINDDADEVSEGSGNYELPLEARISMELALFQHSAGYSLNDPCGNYLCLLDWWRTNVSSFPNVWSLACKILCIPATSAPSERVFSVASNIIEKKRTRLKPKSANVLMLLRGSRNLVEWDA
jgi:hypothetical protein